MSEVKTCTDHLGKVHDNFVAMAQAWGVTPTTVYARLRSGKTLEQALTTPRKKNNSGTPCTDHLGNKFDSNFDMCLHWGVTYTSFRWWRKQGLPLQDILEKNTPARGHKHHTQTCTDHLGNKFESIIEMCRAYGITYSVYKRRACHGWPIRDILTTPQGVRIAQEATDHFGQRFKSVAAMCKYHRVGINTYYARLRQGLPMEMALMSQKICNTICTGLRGEIYNSVKECAKAYKVPATTLYHYVSKGLDYKNVLRKPEDRERIQDHNGKWFPTQKAMCDFHGIKYSTFRARRRAGQSLQEALNPDLDRFKCFDLDGVHYSSMADFARRRNIPMHIVRGKQIVANRKFKKPSAVMIAKRALTAWECDQSAGKHVILTKKIVFRGVAYASAKDFCRRSGIGLSFYRYNAKKGLTPAQIFKLYQERYANK